MSSVLTVEIWKCHAKQQEISKCHLYLLVMPSEGFYTWCNNLKEVMKMTFAEKLKACRKQAGLSQEQLAEKLGVSRQAVTKWETDAGIPDIENIMAISALFDISIDELLSNERGEKKPKDYLYESITEYDIDEPKRYDMKFGGAKRFQLSGYEGEKIRVRLASNTLSTLQNDFKVKIDDIRKRIDVDVIRKNGISEATAKEAVSILVQIPMLYVGKLSVLSIQKPQKSVLQIVTVLSLM